MMRPFVIHRDLTRRRRLERLAGLIERIEGRELAVGQASGLSGPMGHASGLSGPVGQASGLSRTATGWSGPDGVLGGGLARGAIHEWFSDGGDEGEPAWEGLPTERGVLVQAALIHLARQSLGSLSLEEPPGWRGEKSRGTGLHSSSGTGLRPVGRVLWIGRRCWPYPAALAHGGDRRLLEASIFVDAAEQGERVWAIDLALRSPGVAAVVADASGIGMAESRRLQLAAAAGGSLGLLARPWRERGEISAARTRWRVSPRPTSGRHPQWTVELLRCKGVQPASEDAWRWAVQRDHATGVVSLVADAADRGRAAARSSA